MPAFLQRFFPTVYERQQADTSSSPYCIFDDQVGLSLLTPLPRLVVQPQAHGGRPLDPSLADHLLRTPCCLPPLPPPPAQGLQFFTSSMWLAAMPVAPFSGDTSRAMPCGGACFLLGAALNAAAQSLAMLIAGRILLGCGVGCAYQAVPMYLSECAPFQHRGALNILFQLTTTVGILAAQARPGLDTSSCFCWRSSCCRPRLPPITISAPCRCRPLPSFPALPLALTPSQSAPTLPVPQLINYFVMNWDEGWRLSLGLAAVPALLLLGGGLFLPESPNSLLERGHHERALAVLRRLRGCCDVDVSLVTGWAVFAACCRAAMFPLDPWPGQAVLARVQQLLVLALSVFSG